MYTIHLSGHERSRKITASYILLKNNEVLSHPILETRTAKKPFSNSPELSQHAKA
jgi:hypothetical protein